MRFRFLSRLDCFDGTEDDADSERLPFLRIPSGVLKGGFIGTSPMSTEPFDRYEGIDATDGLRPPGFAAVAPLVDGL